MTQRAAGGRTLLLLSVLYAAWVIPHGIHKGVDLESHLVLAEGLLKGEPIYQDHPGVGMWWPPFAILTLTPFALIARMSLSWAKGIFALLNVLCLSGGIALYGRAHRRYLAVAVAAVAVPLADNFDYLNLNAVLLVLVAAGAFDLAKTKDARAGVWFGLATALKVFPGLLLLYAAYRRRWRTVLTGGGLALALTVCSLLPLGWTNGLLSAQGWLGRSATGGAWVVQRRNQSLPAMLIRADVPHDWVIVIDLAFLALAAWALRRPTEDDTVVDDVGIVTLLAILVAPIAWDHYFLLALPAWVAALSIPPDARSRALRIALFAIALVTSGFLTVWSYPARVALLDHSMYCWGALALIVLLLVDRMRNPAGSGAAAGRTPDLMHVTRNG